MIRTDPNPRWLGLAVLAGVSGIALFALLVKPRSRNASRFLADFPAYAVPGAGRLKSGGFDGGFETSSSRARRLSDRRRLGGLN